MTRKDFGHVSSKKSGRISPSSEHGCIGWHVLKGSESGSDAFSSKHREFVRLRMSSL